MHVSAWQNETCRNRGLPAVPARAMHTSSPSPEPSIHWERHTTPPEARVPLRSKIAYGAGAMADFLNTQVPTGLAIPVYARHFGLDTGLLGIANAIPRVIAVLSASLIGGISDNTRTRWGRRKPFILFGAVMCALVLPWLWLAPRGAGAMGLFLFFGGMMAVYSIFDSILSVPHQAMGLELSDDYDERTRVQAWKGYVSGIGFLMAPWFYWFCTREIFPDVARGAMVLSVIIGVIIVLGAGLTVWLCRERTTAMRQEKIPIGPALALTLRNRAFLLLQGAAVLLMFSISSGGTVGFYLNIDYVCRGDEKFGALLGGVGGTVTTLMTYVGTALGLWFSTHLGKRTVGLLGLGLVLVGGLLVSVFLAPSYDWLPWIPEKHHPWFTMIPGIIINLGLQACNLVFSSMLADVCDEDELATGLRREGAYVAVATVINRVVGIALILVSGFMPYLAGYTDMTQSPTEPQLLAMKWTLIVVQGAAVVAAIAFLYFYPINRHRAEEIRRTLNTRNNQKALP